MAEFIALYLIYFTEMKKETLLTIECGGKKFLYAQGPPHFPLSLSLSDSTFRAKQKFKQWTCLPLACASVCIEDTIVSPSVLLQEQKL